MCILRRSWTSSTPSNGRQERALEHGDTSTSPVQDDSSIHPNPSGQYHCISSPRTVWIRETLQSLDSIRERWTSADQSRISKLLSSLKEEVDGMDRQWDSCRPPSSNLTASLACQEILQAIDKEDASRRAARERPLPTSHRALVEALAGLYESDLISPRDAATITAWRIARGDESLRAVAGSNGSSLNGPADTAMNDDGSDAEIEVDEFTSLLPRQPGSNSSTAREIASYLGRLAFPCFVEGFSAHQA